MVMAKKSLFAEPHFQNDEAARAMLESILWPDGPVCPHCGVVNHSYKTNRPRRFPFRRNPPPEGLFRHDENRDGAVAYRPAQMVAGLPPHDFEQEGRFRP